MSVTTPSEAVVISYDLCQPMDPILPGRGIAMNNLREQLHLIVDSLPDQSLEHSKLALEYCANPEQHQMNIEKGKAAPSRAFTKTVARAL